MNFMNWNDFKSWLQTLPKWLRIVVIVVAFAIAALVTVMETSCSSIRISQTSTGEVKVSSSQNVLDSTKIEINVLNSRTK